MQPLQQRWLDLCQRLGASGDVDGIYADLARRHGEPHRAYHNLTHLEQCFAELDRERRRFVEPAPVELAVFFHDAIYSVYFGNNEKRSAALAVESMQRMGLGQALQERVSALILATRTHAGLDDADLDGLMFLDIDMSILGQERHAFEIYEAAIRREFAWVPEWFFNRKRRRFLAALLARPRIFLSEPFHDRYEARARENIERSLQALDTGPVEVTVSFDEDRIWTAARGRARESVRWSELARVLVVTTDDGPFADDMFLVLIGDQAGCVFPVNCTGAEAIRDRLMELPGFRSEPFIAAMGSTDNRSFVCWERDGD